MNEIEGGRGALPVRERRVKEKKMRERVKGCIFCFCGEKQKKRVFLVGKCWLWGCVDEYVGERMNVCLFVEQVGVT
jgi:hypothetical protein